MKTRLKLEKLERRETPSDVSGGDGTVPDPLPPTVPAMAPSDPLIIPPDLKIIPPPPIGP